MMIGEGMLQGMAQLGLEELRAAVSIDNGASMEPVSLQSIQAEAAQAPVQEAQMDYGNGM
jgi:hypothetical protein